MFDGLSQRHDQIFHMSPFTWIQSLVFGVVESGEPRSEIQFIISLVLSQHIQHCHVDHCFFPTLRLVRIYLLNSLDIIIFSLFQCTLMSHVPLSSNILRWIHLKEYQVRSIFKEQFLEIISVDIFLWFICLVRHSYQSHCVMSVLSMVYYLSFTNSYWN